MSIEALKQALEWIEAQPEPRMIGATKVITALRQAIEQAQPVADIVSDSTGFLSTRWRDGWLPKIGDKLYTAPPRQPEGAQPTTYEEVMLSMNALRIGTLEQQQIYEVMKNKTLYTEAPPPSQPVAFEGWRLVPVKPTQMMAKAAADAWLDCNSKLLLNKSLAAVKAGINAAPPRQPDEVIHRQGCDALGGYGHGVGPCSCGATEVVPPPKPRLGWFHQPRQPEQATYTCGVCGVSMQMEIKEST